MSPLLEEAREVHDFAGLSDRLIAQATGAKPSTVRGWLAGRSEPTGVRASVNVPTNQVRAFKHADVLGRRRKRHLQRRRQLGEVLLPLGQPLEHRPPGGMGKGVKNAGEVGDLLYNHLV